MKKVLAQNPSKKDAQSKTARGSRDNIGLRETKSNRALVIKKDCFDKFFPFVNCLEINRETWEPDTTFVALRGEDVYAFTHVTALETKFFVLKATWIVHC